MLIFFALKSFFLFLFKQIFTNFFLCQVLHIFKKYLNKIFIVHLKSDLFMNHLTKERNILIKWTGKRYVFEN